MDIGISEAGGRLEVRFADDAPTLSAADRERVFERFYRTEEARDTSSGASGSGLGLAIVQWAVALHGGSVRVEPRSPRGNVFVVELPRAPAPARIASTPAAAGLSNR